MAYMLIQYITKFIESITIIFYGTCSKSIYIGTRDYTPTFNYNLNVLNKSLGINYISFTNVIYVPFYF